MKFKFLSIALVIFGLNTSNAALAGLITFDSIDNGWYDNTGDHSPTNTNTYTANLGTNTLYNSFYNFNLSNSLEDKIINSASVTFRSNGIFTSDNNFETFQVWDVTTTPGLGDSISVFNDLMTGAMYGAQQVTSNAEFTVLLNSIAISDMLGGGAFSLGGHIAPSIGSSILFSFSGGVAAARLNIDYTAKQPTQDVPEPSTLAIFALGMLGLASRRFKKQS